MSGLRLLNETIVSDSSTSSIEVADVFTTDFDVYQVTVSNISLVDGTQTRLHLRLLNSSGSKVYESLYDSAVYEQWSNTTYDEEKLTSQNYWRGMAYADKHPECANGVFYFINPATPDTYSWVMGETSVSQIGTYQSNTGIGVLKKVAPMTGFCIYEGSTRPIKNANIRTYGLRVDS